MTKTKVTDNKVIADKDSRLQSRWQTGQRQRPRQIAGAGAARSSPQMFDATRGVKLNLLEVRTAILLSGTLLSGR